MLNTYLDASISTGFCGKTVDVMKGNVLDQYFKYHNRHNGLRFN